MRVRGLEMSCQELRVPRRGLDFGVARGTVFAPPGSNGAGTTTVVRILATLLNADARTSTVGA
jgi:ABC-2 type transport system ATP-binding protein